MTLWQRLWWAFVGWKTDGRVLVSPSDVVNVARGGVLSGPERHHLSGSIDLAVELLSAHFHPNITAPRPGDAQVEVGSSFGTGIFSELGGDPIEFVGTQEFGVPLGEQERADILLSAAGWLMQQHGHHADRFRVLCENARRDVFGK